MTKNIKNKLSIYLIKKEYSSPKNIFKDYQEKIGKDKLNFEKIRDGSELMLDKARDDGEIGELFYGDSYIFEPSWLKKFFGESFNNSTSDKKKKIFTATSKAVFLVNVSVEDKKTGEVENRIFAITFGYGRPLLKLGVWEERFGFKTAVNIIDPDNLRSIDKKNMTHVPKQTIDQIARHGTYIDLGVNIEEDLIQGMAGKTKENYINIFGRNVSGKDALNLSVEFDISNIKLLLENCYERYCSDDYKDGFAWIDHVFETKDPVCIEKLKSKLIEKIKSEKFDEVWMAVPEIVKWEDVGEFKFQENSFGNDIDLPQYFNFLSDREKEELSAKSLKKQKIDCISASSGKPIDSWAIYDCLYCEISDVDNKTFILSNGKWYNIEDEFVENVSNSFDSLMKKNSGVKLSPCNDEENEFEYNTRMEKEIEGVCNMDRKIIQYGGKYQKVEFCDLFMKKEKKLIHVKHRGASVVLGHLFNQGLISGELFIWEEGFRKKVNEKLPKEYNLGNFSKRPVSSDYEIIFAIISKYEQHQKDFDIPFFSKIALTNVRRRLENLGYQVSMLNIPTLPQKNKGQSQPAKELQLVTKNS